MSDNKKGMFKCPKCKNYMEKYATNCPTCGWKNWYYKKPFSKNENVNASSIIVAILVVLGIFVWLKPDTQKKNDNKATTTVVNNTNLSSYDYELSLQELYDEFSKNYVRASQNIMYKRIKVTAPLNKIEKENAGVLTVIVDAYENDGKAKDSWTELTLKEKNLNCFAVFDFKGGDDSGIIDYNVGDTITIVGHLNYANGNTLGFKDSKIIGGDDN